MHPSDSVVVGIGRPPGFDAFHFKVLQAHCLVFFDTIAQGVINLEYAALPDPFASGLVPTVVLREVRAVFMLLQAVPSIKQYLYDNLAERVLVLG